MRKKRKRKENSKQGLGGQNTSLGGKRFHLFGGGGSGCEAVKLEKLQSKGGEHRKGKKGLEKSGVSKKPH